MSECHDDGCDHPEHPPQTAMQERLADLAAAVPPEKLAAMPRRERRARARELRRRR